jgi:CMP-N,N'-diacetyllegionaminic acid synthase
MEVLAIIPARGGSKGLPNKNILPLLGHPLIAYSIKAALDANLVTRTIVSTDAEPIANVAAEYGAEIPFRRPDEFAQDMSTDLEVFVHALEWLYKEEGYRPDYVVQLRPTSPVRPTGLIDTCIQKLTQTNFDSLRIVTPSPITPYKMWVINGENEPMTPLLSLPGVPAPYNEPRQRLPQTYWQIGTLDVIKTEVILHQNSMSGQNILPYIVGPELAVDIDDLSSFEKAGTVINQSNYVRF